MTLSGCANHHHTHYTLTPDVLPFPHTHTHTPDATLTNHLCVTEQTCKDLGEDLAMSHAIEIENLEFKISRMALPRPKFSKRVIELTRSENELVRLKLYDDAAQVRRMLGKIQPQEEAAWTKKFDQSIQDMRHALHEKQDNAWIRLSEKTKTLRWTAFREKEKQEKNGVQRVVNHRHDMVCMCVGMVCSFPAFALCIID
jgi:hypothetical protein